MRPHAADAALVGALEDCNLTISSTVRTRLLASTMLTGAVMAAFSGAQAATAAAADQSVTQVQELVVTGSRIPSKNLTSVSPITTVNSAVLKQQGTTNIEDVINNLPQAFGDQGAFQTNGASGTATINLRGLGPGRTLVLIDGQRMAPGDPSYPYPDIDTIPAALIDRVEVLTGGASAVYGSDAIAGVVNFILRKNFEGIQFDAETTIGEHNNNSAQMQAADANSVALGYPSANLPKGAVWTGQRHTFSVSGGANSPDGKGNVEFYLGYNYTEGVRQDKYDWSKCQLKTNKAGNKQTCFGSANDATGYLLPLSNSAYNIAHFGTTSFDAILSRDTVTPFDNSQRFNFAPYQYIQRPDQRWTAGEFSHYEVAPWLDIYTSFMFMNDHTTAQLGPSAAFAGSGTPNIPCNDPLLSPTQAILVCGPDAGVAGKSGTIWIGRRNVEGGPRTYDINHSNFRSVLGFKGDLGQTWHYDVSFQYGRADYHEADGGTILVSHVLNALDVVPSAAGPVCASGGNCVPWNIWQAGGVTPAALNYISTTAELQGYTEQQIVEGSISGDLGQYGAKSPWASDGVGVSLGAEYTRNALQYLPDGIFQSGDVDGTGGGEILPVNGSQSSKAIFGEIRVPIVQDMPFFKELTLEAGYRYSNYTHGGGNNTFKVGGDWQVTPDLRLRASFERAVRAPGVNELFSPPNGTTIAGADPCSGKTPTPTAAQCFLTFAPSHPGVSEATFASTIYGHIADCISGQCDARQGGNPDLRPESANTWSFGFVFTPTFFRGLSVSVDYFNIKVNDVITLNPFATILTQCLNGVLTQCDLIHRSPANTLFGTNGYVLQLESNLSSLQTKGIDVNADYRRTVGDYGSVDFNFAGTYLDSYTLVIPGAPPEQCAGLYGPTCSEVVGGSLSSGTTAPKWKHTLRATWQTPWNLSLTLAWRYLSGTTLDFNANPAVFPNNKYPGSPDPFPADAHIPAFNYFDASFQYKLRNRYTFRGGVNNLFDRTPPLLDSGNIAISGSGNANTFPQTFDPLGRVFFVGLTADF